VNGRHRIWPAIAGTLGVLALAYLAFGGSLPFSGAFEIHARFADAKELTPGNPVRIAGLQIGSVSSVSAGPGSDATVNIALDQPQLVHADATFAIKPRLLFEGNNYVDVSPGTPSAPQIADGASIPAGRTSSAVGVQQVLDTFTSPVRTDVQSTLAALAGGLGSPGSGVPPGYAGLRSAAHALATSLTPLSTTAQALRGTQAGDLDRTIDDTGEVTAELAQNPAALADFVTSYDHVFGTLASRSQNIEASLSQMLGLLSAAPPQLRSIDAALPHLTTFAGALRPTLQAAPPALTDASTALDQIRATVAPSALPALLRDTAPVARSLPTLEQHLGALMPRITPVAKCLQRNIVPALDEVVPAKVDGSGRPAWQDLVHLGAALAGASPDFDGNGTTIRLGVTENELSLTSIVPGLGQLIGVGTNGMEGVQPEPLGPGVVPPLRPDQPCDRQPLPNLSLRAAGAPSSITTSRAPGLTPFMQKLGQELFGGTAAGRSAALSQLLALVPMVAHHAAASSYITPTSGRGSHASGAGPSSASTPAGPAAPTGATGKSVLGLTLPGLGLGSTGAAGSLGQTIKSVLTGLLGALHK
jgi:virulence factor Mce-like protein